MFYNTVSPVAVPFSNDAMLISPLKRIERGPPHQTDDLNIQGLAVSNRQPCQPDPGFLYKLFVITLHESKCKL